MGSVRARVAELPLPRTPAAHPPPQPSSHLLEVHVLHALGDIDALNATREGQAQGQQEALHGCGCGCAELPGVTKAGQRAQALI